MWPPKKRLRAGVLGATGTVGQRFIELLSGNEHFEIYRLGASLRSAGKTYVEATNWKISSSIPRDIGSMSIKECAPSEFSDCDIVFSALDADVAGEIGQFEKI